MLRELLHFMVALRLVTAQETGDLRLVDGDAPYEGRLEIYIDRSGWGTICVGGSETSVRGFNLLEADTVCRQLGYTRAAAVGTVTDLGVPSGNGSIALGQVNCPMQAEHLYNNCTYSTYCVFQYRQAVAVSCRDIESNPKDGDFRLVDSQGRTNVSAGRLETHFNGSWTTFCSIDMIAANILCWRTARGRYHVYGTVEELGYLPGAGDIANISCGPFSQFDSCSITLSPGCSHQDDVAVSCVACNSDDVCDRSLDCDMCVDECHCHEGIKYITCNDCVCGENEFKCVESGVCVSIDSVCDSYRDCSDYSDENTPECVELRRQNREQGDKELKEFGGHRAGIAVGIIFGVLLLLLVPLLLCLCLPPCPLRKVYFGTAQAVLESNMEVPSDRNTTITSDPPSTSAAASVDHES